MGGAAKKNLRVFREICGDKRLDHVRIVTTNWNLVDEKQGNSRQDALAKGAFGPLINEGARLCPHDRGLESAQSIMSQLIHQEPVTIMIQEELNAGRTLGDTSAGALIVEEMKELKKKHDREVEELKKELEDASMVNNEDLILELAEERRKLEAMMAHAEEDRNTLQKTRVPRETLPKLDTGEQLAATKALPRIPPLPQRPYGPQDNEMTDRGSQLPQALHDTRRLQPDVLPPARHHPYPQGQGDDTAGHGSHFPQVLHGTWRVQPVVPSVPPPPQRRNCPHCELHFPQVLHDMVEVIRNYSKAGGKRFGYFGVLSGGFVGLWLSPFIVAKRAMDRRQ